MRLFRTTQLLDFARNIAVSFLKISSLRRLVDSPLNFGRIRATSDIFLTHLLHQARWAWASKRFPLVLTALHSCIYLIEKSAGAKCRQNKLQNVEAIIAWKTAASDSQVNGQWSKQCSTHPQEDICWRFLLITILVQSTKYCKIMNIG